MVKGGALGELGRQLLLHFLLPKATGEIRQCLKAEIGALAVFLLQLMLHLPSGKGEEEIISGLVSTIAIFLRKGELVNLKCGSHNIFKGSLSSGESVP
jgi:hypothetical protein